MLVVPLAAGGAPNSDGTAGVVVDAGTPVVGAVEGACAPSVEVVVVAAGVVVPKRPPGFVPNKLEGAVVAGWVPEPPAPNRVPDGWVVAGVVPNKLGVVVVAGWVLAAPNRLGPVVVGAG